MGALLVIPKLFNNFEPMVAWSIVGLILGSMALYTIIKWRNEE